MIDASKLPSPDPHRCPKCLGTNVQLPMWVRINTGEIQDDYGCDDLEVWCEDCRDLFEGFADTDDMPVASSLSSPEAEPEFDPEERDDDYV